MYAEALKPITDTMRKFPGVWDLPDAAGADKIKRLESIPLGDRFDYSTITSISTEARQKLERIRPATVAQASRIPGVSPADINILLLLCGR